MANENRKTTREFWESTHTGVVRPRLPSTLVVGTRNLLRLLRSETSPGMRVLELGFVPGKHLAYLAAKLDANVAGIDYSREGVERARSLFSALGLTGDFRCEDMFESTFPRATFDLVYSSGVIEHFEDPSELVRIHVELVRPGGVALIAIPDYGGVYGTLQRYFDPDNLAIHNLRIMSVDALESLSPRDLVRETRCFHAGRLSPGLVNLGRRWPRPVALLSHFVLNAVGVLQPLDLRPVCPMLVLRMVRMS